MRQNIFIYLIVATQLSVRALSAQYMQQLYAHKTVPIDRYVVINGIQYQIKIA